MKIIDFHNHIYPEKIARKATDAVGAFYDMPAMERTGTIDELLDSHKAAGIDTCVIHAVATTPHQVEVVNDYVAKMAYENKGSIYAFGSLHQDYDNKIMEIDRCISMGLKGIKLHPDTQQFNVDDEKLLEAYEYMQGKLPLLLHAGDYRYDYSHPRRIQRICRMFPDLLVIAAHFGGWSVYDEGVTYLLSEENCMVDTSSTSGFTTPEKFKELIHTFGDSRLLFGTDFPMWDPKGELDRFMAVNLSDDQRENILYKNAADILKIK
ncbi:MAG: amidohydrolase family protein [Clostridia bacterium]|nr:amidohydrolase family protein [Clostridia bacterium]